MDSITKNIIKFTVFIIILILVYAGGFKSANYFIKPIDKIKIIEKKTPVVKYIAVPSTCDDYKDCFTNAIKINPRMLDNVWISITADDSCKSTVQSFKLAGIAKLNPNMILLNYVHMFNFYNGFGMEMGGNLSYYRILLSASKFNFGIGGGVTITNHSGGINLGTIFQF